jgi:hypothetical protein
MFRFAFSTSGHPAVLPFTVTKPVTSRVMSIAVVSRDVNLVFGEDLIGSSCDVSVYVP